MEFQFGYTDTVFTNRSRLNIQWKPPISSRFLHEFPCYTRILLVCELFTIQMHSMSMKKVANRRIPLYLISKPVNL